MCCCCYVSNSNAGHYRLGNFSLVLTVDKCRSLVNAIYSDTPSPNSVTMAVTFRVRAVMWNAYHCMLFIRWLLGLLRVLEYSSLSISGCKFILPVAVFAVS